MSDDGGGMMIMVLMMGLSCSSVISMGAVGFLWYNNNLCEWFGETGPEWICNTSLGNIETGAGIVDTSPYVAPDDCKAKAKAYCDTSGKKGKEKDSCMAWFRNPRQGNCCVKTCTPKAAA